MTYGDVKKVCSFRLGAETLKHIDTIIRLGKTRRYWGGVTKTEALEQALEHYAGHLEKAAEAPKGAAGRASASG